jgi:hypothetical protein
MQNLQRRESKILAPSARLNTEYSWFIRRARMAIK